MHINELRLGRFKDIPNLPGVYFFYNQQGTLVYVGKSINIRKRVQQHFSEKDRKSVKIQMQVSQVDFEVMGSELIALLYESELIKQHLPLYNRSQRRVVYQYGLYRVDVNGYVGLRIDKIILDQEALTAFSTLREAKEALYRITEKYRLCQKINGLYKSTTSCFQYQIKACDGACMGYEPTSIYNDRVEKFLKTVRIERFTRLFEVKGRDEDEIGLVYIENGVYMGFGFCPKSTTENKIRFILPRRDNKDVRRILIRYLINN